jgi:diaminopimelate epimerase
MIFFKYEALGNDFIITKESSIDFDEAVKLCDRNFGIGADGVLVHLESEECDAEMKIINSDGSVPEMCGNGFRCFVSYLVMECGFSSNPLKIMTGRGLLTAKWSKKSSGIEVSANLGKAEWLGTDQTEMEGCFFDLYGVSMGNPHIVAIPQKRISNETAKGVAENLQKNNFLGIEVNLEVITDLDFERKSISMIVKERGAGFTLGCGTGGAAAVNAVARRRNEKTGLWDLSFPGGIAGYEILENGETVMTGVPNKVFKGEIL